MTEDKKKEPVAGLDSTGRYIRFDDRGNAVWKFRTEDIEESQDADLTYNMLKSLDLDALEIEDTQIRAARSLGKTEVMGSDPYNSGPKPKKKS